MPRLNWSRPLPRTLIIPDVMTIRTVADVRDLIERHLPVEVREKPTWRHVASLLPEAAAGADTVDVSVALRLVLELERVPCQPIKKPDQLAPARPKSREETPQAGRR